MHHFISDPVLSACFPLSIRCGISSEVFIWPKACVVAKGLEWNQLLISDKFERGQSEAQVLSQESAGRGDVFVLHHAFPEEGELGTLCSGTCAARTNLFRS